MKKYTIAFDCDGTLISNTTSGIVANERIRTLLISLASFKNIEIWIWSGGGELYARQISNVLGLDSYVKRFKTKNLLGHDASGQPFFDPSERPDFAIDDIQACELGLLANFIVNEK